MTKNKPNIEEEIRNQSAHSSAVARYNAKNYKTFSVNLKQDEYEALLCVLATTKQSKSGFVRAALDYANKNDQFMEYLRKLYETK